MFLCAGSIYAQDKDTLYIQLFDHNDLSTDEKDKTNVTSTNRLADNSEDMAQQVIIIDGDEIRKFGYSTLVDVLKGIPGFRTSQPGNSQEGETFLMRGLYGNDHTKIMINGIPIKPEAVSGMPIGAQLPIRHAERIEIVLGPSSSSYGSDAIAGVINIVLPEIDRPVFAWADVNLLSPKTSEFNLTLGGKVGKGKNILNYEIFASSYLASDVNLFIEDDSIDVDPSTLNNFQLNLLKEVDDVPEIDDMLRESRLLGTYLKFRWFEFSAMNMYRNEHVGFGNQPLNYSYNDPSTTFGENINSISLKYKDQKSKRYMSSAAISALTYRTMTNSSYNGINHALSNGKNFMYARSLDLYGEYTGILKINKQIRMAIGSTANFGISHPFTNFLLKPFKSEESSFNLAPQDELLQTGTQQSASVDSISMIAGTQFLERYTSYNVSGFIHFSYKTKSGKISCEGGSRIDVNSFNEYAFTPKLGVVYRPTDRLKIRGFYGSGYRAPRSYYLYNNYYADFGAYQQNGAKLKRERAPIQSEYLQGLEAAVDWKPTNDLQLSLQYFGHLMENKVMRQIYDTLPPPPGAPPKERVGFGYFNGESYSILQSIMLTVHYKKQIGKLGIDAMVAYEFAKGNENVEPDENAPQESEKSPGYRFVPEHSFNGNFSFTIFDFTLSLRNKIFGDYVTEIYRVNRRIEYTELDKFYYNLDILLHKQLFRQLSIFGGVYNVTNKGKSGIPNVNISNTWTYNPQYGTYYKFGLTFKLN